MTPRRSSAPLEHEGYTRVHDETNAGLILYNTCSIRDKSRAKSLPPASTSTSASRRRQEVRRHRLRRPAGGRGHLRQGSLRSPSSAGSASYRNLPDMLARLEAGETRITGLDDRQTDLTFETDLYLPLQPPPRLHHHHRRLRQVLRLLRSSLTLAAKSAPAPPPPSS